MYKHFTLFMVSFMLTISTSSAQEVDKAIETISQEPLSVKAGDKNLAMSKNKLCRSEDKNEGKRNNKSKNLSQKDSEQCKPYIKNIEHIEVIGRNFTPISSSAEGVYTLDKQLLKEYLFGNGNLNDVIGILPGVQYSESAYAANQVSNIKPSEVSISGAEGYQSGYQIDGVSNNSRLSSGNSPTDRNLASDVAGHSQEAFINLKILEQLEVYDSNIPAKYGQFSGGLVLATTQNSGKKPHFGVSYRQTADQFVEYHKFYAPDYSGEDILATATFNKKDLNAYLSMPISYSGGIVMQVQMLKSEESLNQLGTLKEQEQTNYNGLFKFHHNFTPEDELVLRYLNAPYEGSYFNVNAIRSDYHIVGGGQSLMAQWRADRKWGNMDTQFDWHQSQNSKDTQSAWYVWANVPGKSWGEYNGSRSSLEGGYGDIKKTQDTYSFKQDFELPSLWEGFGAHDLSFGYQIENQQTVFDRLEDSVVYNGSIISPTINCNGYVSDCIETTFKKPIAEIEAELGRALDLFNPDDFLLYQRNLMTTGQLFQTRQVSIESRAEAKINYFSSYVEDSISFDEVQLAVGVRYDYNDFFKNHNIAPRFRLSYEFMDGYQVILGSNRYYQSDLASYKLNQAMQPVHNEVRSILNNRPQQWQAALLNKGYLYEYKDTKTPFSDELTAAFRQPLFGGVAEVKWIKRANKDSINRIKGYNDAGEAILYAGNDGNSAYNRWSVSWMAQFSNQHIEFNISHASNTTSRKNFDGDTTIEDSSDGAGTSTLNYSYDDSELVFLRKDENNNDNKLTTYYKLITRNDIKLEGQDANRPIVANVSWGGNWGPWGLSAYARYNGKQDAIYATNKTGSIKEATSICEQCAPNKREYPVYRLLERPQFWLLSGSIRYNWRLPDESIVTLSFDGENLLNKRTYQVGPYTTGLELGRRYWLGISYDY
jgi:hypothetical protein